MTYIKNVWKNKDIITDAKLNKIEKGIEDSHKELALVSDKVDDIEKKIEGRVIQKIIPERVWKHRENSDPVYSTPIVSSFTQNGRLVVAHQSWDWRGFIRDFHTGEILFERWFSDELYGRPQAGDVNNDGLTEFFFASHAGEIRCYNECNELLWEQFDEYTRQGSGTIESSTAFTIVDSSKSWFVGTYVRNKNQPNENAIVEITGVEGVKQLTTVSEVNNSTLSVADEITIPLDSSSTYKIIPRYESDIMFQHAGTLVEEEGVWWLYVTGFDNCCRKINPINGDIVWLYPTKEHIEPFPLIADLDGDGNLECYFVSIDWGVYCCDATTGELKWRYETKSGNDAFLNTLTLSNGNKVLVVSSRDSRVHLINPNGTLHNKTTVTHGDIDSSPVVYDFNNDGKQEFIFGGDSGYIYCCNENCETLWRTHVGIYMNSSAIMADVNYDGEMEVLIGDMNGTINVIDPKNGNMIHEIHFQGSVEGTPCIGDFDGDGLIEMVATTCDGSIEMYRFLRQTETNSYDGGGYSNEPKR